MKKIAILGLFSVMFCAALAWGQSPTGSWSGSIKVDAGPPALSPAQTKVVEKLECFLSVKGDSYKLLIRGTASSPIKTLQEEGTWQSSSSGYALNCTKRNGRAVQGERPRILVRNGKRFKLKIATSDYSGTIYFSEM